jgi:hypothetical protein
MKAFLIQTVFNQVVHDFSFHLIEAINYNNWYYSKPVYTYALSETTDHPSFWGKVMSLELDNIIPIGTVEFVLEYLKRWYGIDNVRPLSIPEKLMKPEYLKRKVWHETAEQPKINTTGKCIFVKDNTKIKGFTGVIEPNESYPAGEYLISEYVDIDTEWRAFVYRGELVGLQFYLGDFTLFPDVPLIKQMIENFNYKFAYTLDVGINSNGTFLIECHDFFSCGLYGFADSKILPNMFISTWNKLIGKSLYQNFN